MLRRGFLVITLIFSGVCFAATDSNDELTQQFSHAQQLAAEGKIEQAIAAYQVLIKAQPLLPEAYNNLAALYLKQNKTNDAKHILEQGLYAHKGYGVLYESLTTINVAMAREAYSKALQIDVKPTEINIASLSLQTDPVAKNKNTIVISEVKTPLEDATPVNNTTPLEKITPVKNTIPEEKTTELKIASIAKATGTIKREAVMTKPVVVAKPVSLPQPVETVLQAWSAAWSAQAVDVYLSFYHSLYKPDNGMSRNSWVQSRHYRLKKPSWIKVSLSDFDVQKNTGKQAVVKFKQSYQSNSFREVSDKQMVLIYTDDGWRIYREKSL